MAPSMPTSPARRPINTMTSVGLLCRQYLGAKRDNPMLTGGMAYLMNHLPDEGLPQRLLLVLRDPGHAQHERLRVGHLEPQDARFAGPAPRSAMSTSVPTEAGRRRRTPGAGAAAASCRPASRRLTLEIYYRYLPLFKADADDAGYWAATRFDEKGENPANQ